MEDVDAASRVVYARTKGKEVKRARRKSSVGESVQTPHSSSDGDGRKCLSDEDAKPKAEPGTPETRPSEGAGVDSGSDNEDGKKPAERLVESLVTCLAGAVRNGEEEDGDDRKKAVGPFTSWNQTPCEDALNLAGLLNVLDGVVDSPGRIIVMTTNHPEKLDPALVRPGRINKHLRLTYMTPACLADLVEHYLGAVLTEDQRTQLASLQDRTPAQVEQACAESEGFDDLFPRLKAYASATDTTPTTLVGEGIRYNSPQPSCVSAAQPLLPAVAAPPETERAD
jgi:SpoVK/Ycf46/Vps4 family AAA+-type ATPase